MTATLTEPTTIPATDAPRGLTLSVFRSDYRSPNQKLGHAKQVMLVGTLDETTLTPSTVATPLDPRSRVFSASAIAPPVVLARRHDTWRGNDRDVILTAYPAVWDDEHGVWRKAPGWWMAGATYVDCSDSRLSELAEALTGHRWYGAIALHDYQER